MQKENNKYSTFETIIKKNSHLKNEQLAKKVGKSISWVKVFKAFMRAENKEKYKNTKNPIYKAIYRMWLQDAKAQQKEEEKDILKRLKKELKECKELLSYTNDELEEYKIKYTQITQSYNFFLANLKEEKEKAKKEIEKKYKPIWEKNLKKIYQEEKELKEKIEEYRIIKNEYFDKEREFKIIIRALIIIITILSLLFLFKCL